jgi:PmbA protein
MELADVAVKKALTAGATEAEAYLEKSNTVFVTFADKIESFKAVESVGIGLRVAVGKKTALYSTSILDGREIEEVSRRAVGIAKVAADDPRWKHFNREFGRTSVEGCYDKELEQPDYGKIVGTLTSTIDCMKNYDKRVKPTTSFCAVSMEKVFIANNYGESGERRGTEASVFLTAKAEEAGMNSVGIEEQQARKWVGIDFESLATRAAEKAVKYLKAKPIQSGKMPVIIKNKIFANLLGIFLNGPIGADWVQNGRSPLAGKLGEQIASDNVDLVDDGKMRGGLRSEPFDDEGHPTQTTQIIEKGVLRNYLYDTYTALNENVKSTGNASKIFGYWTKPQPMPSNLILKPEKARLEEIISETRKGLYVEQTIGEWLSNPVSGDLSATVAQGFLIENGVEAQPVNGVVIAGNFYELLKEGVEVLGSDVGNSVGTGVNIYSPTVKLAQLTIAGE